MHVYVCIYINVCWYLFKYACMLVYVYTCILIHVGNSCMWVCLQVSMRELMGPYDVYVCMNSFTCMYSIVCMCTWVYTYVSVCTCRCSVYLYLYVSVRLCGTVFRTHSVRSGPVVGDPDPIRIRACCGPDT